MADAQTDLIKIGQITSPQGIRGEVRVFPLTDFPERFHTLRQALLGPDARPIGVTYRGVAGNVLVVAIEGVTDRDQADKLRGQYLQVPRSEAHPLPEGYYYDHDLIGLAVVDPDGKLLGKLVGVDRSSPVHHLYVVQTPDGEQHLVPAVKAFVQSIDLAQGTMVITPIPGLLEE